VWIQNLESYIPPSHMNQQRHMWRHIPFLIQVEVEVWVSKYKNGTLQYGKVEIVHLHCRGLPKHWKNNKERTVCNKVCLKVTEPLQGSSFACCVDADMSAFRINIMSYSIVNHGLQKIAVCANSAMLHCYSIVVVTFWQHFGLKAIAICSNICSTMLL